MTPGNYSVHFREEASRLRPEAPFYKDYTAVAACLSAAEHFILPDQGKLLACSKPPSFEPELLRPPYPITALEFSDSVSDLPEGRQRSARRLILAMCFADGEGVTLTPISYLDEMRQWVLSGSFHLASDWWDYENETVRVGVSLLDWVPAAYTPAQFLNDNQLELDAYLQMCYALSCSNVSTESHEPPPKLNKARARRGRLPFQTYKVLTIPGASSAHSSTPSGRVVRTHLRRGHIRRLPTKRVWVNACVVKGGGRGFVKKDYKVAC